MGAGPLPLARPRERSRARRPWRARGAGRVSHPQVRVLAGEGAREGGAGRASSAPRGCGDYKSPTQASRLCSDSGDAQSALRPAQVSGTPARPSATARGRRASGGGVGGARCREAEKESALQREALATGPGRRPEGSSALGARRGGCLVARRFGQE